MDNEQINRAIHEKVVGECWHEWHLVKGRGQRQRKACSKCPAYRGQYGYDPNFDYANDLNAVAKAETVVIEQKGTPFPLLDALERITGSINTTWATARQRAEAVLKAMDIQIEGDTGGA